MANLDGGLRAANGSTVQALAVGLAHALLASQGAPICCTFCSLTDINKPRWQALCVCQLRAAASVTCCIRQLDAA